MAGASVSKLNSIVNLFLYLWKLPDVRRGVFALVKLKKTMNNTKVKVVVVAPKKDKIPKRKRSEMAPVKF